MPWLLSRAHENRACSPYSWEFKCKNKHLSFEWTISNFPWKAYVLSLGHVVLPFDVTLVGQILFSRKACTFYPCFFSPPGKHPMQFVFWASIKQVCSTLQNTVSTHFTSPLTNVCGVSELLSYFCAAANGTRKWMFFSSVRCTSLTEKDLKTKCVIEMEGNQTILHPACGNMGKGDTR